MKKLLILSILAFGLVGCEKCKKSIEYDNTWANHGYTIITKVVQIEGHKYIILCGSHAGTIIHAESCDCRK